jgi:hypothetical protein
MADRPDAEEDVPLQNTSDAHPEKATYKRIAVHLLMLLSTCYLWRGLCPPFFCEKYFLFYFEKLDLFLLSFTNRCLDI